MGSYELRAHIDARTPDELVTTLRRIAHHIEVDHADLTGPGEVVNTITAGGNDAPSWSVRVTHVPAEVHA